MTLRTDFCGIAGSNHTGAEINHCGNCFYIYSRYLGGGLRPKRRAPKLPASKMAVVQVFVALSLAMAVIGGSLADVKHLVMIMFENRSFDHVCLVTYLYS